MRISDWSADVCSSDRVDQVDPAFVVIDAAGRAGDRAADLVADRHATERAVRDAVGGGAGDRAAVHQLRRSTHIGDRKSVAEGKSVSVRVDLGGRRSLKKKKNLNNI